MSKNLEKEYRAFANSEVPNLWSRIEAELDEKTTSDSLVSESDTDVEKIGQNMTDFHKKWHSKKSSFKVWAGLAAACVCVALIIPAVVSTMWRGGRSSGSDSAAPEYTPQMMETYDSAAGAYEEGGVYIAGAASGAETAREESVAEVAEVTVDDSGGADSSAVPENAYVSSNANTNFTNGPDSNLNAGTGNASGVNYDEGAESAGRPDANAGADNASEGLNTGVDNAAASAEADQFAVTVEILDTDVRMNSGVLYTAKVIASDNPIVQADSEIRIFSPAASPEGVVVFENAQVYELILQKKVVDDSEQEEIYVLVRR